MVQKFMYGVSEIPFSHFQRSSAEVLIDFRPCVVRSSAFWYLFLMYFSRLFNDHFFSVEMGRAENFLVYLV